MKSVAIHIPVDHVPGVCIWCNQTFDPNKSKYYYGDEKCANDYEAKLAQKSNEDLVARMPLGTTFSLPL